MSRPPVDWFAVLFGAYLGGFAAFAVGAVPGLTVLGWQAGVAGLVAFAGTVTVVATRDHLAVELARTDWNVAVIVAPIPLLFGLLGVQGFGDAAPSAEFVLLLAVAVLGIAVHVVGNRRVIEWASDADAIVISWTASPTVRRIRGLRVLLVGGGVGLVAAGLVVHHPITEVGTTFGIVSLVYGLLAGRARGYGVLSEGLYVQQTGTFAGQFFPWPRLTGYRVTDDALIIDRWIPLVAFSSRLDDIDDLDAVTGALDRMLGGETVTDRRDPVSTTGTD